VGVPWERRRISRGLAWCRALGRRTDLLVLFGTQLAVLRTLGLVMALFLLPFFNASGECCGRPPPVRVWAENGSPMVDAPLVVVDARSVRLDGVLVAHGAELEEPSGLLSSLRDQLVNKRNLALQLGHRSPPEVCLFIIAPEVPASVVHRVVATASSAGFTETSFVVNHWPPMPSFL
jgi:hypothetical protein